jgi:hypothetical protein
VEKLGRLDGTGMSSLATGVTGLLHCIIVMAGLFCIDTHIQGLHERLGFGYGGVLICRNGIIAFAGTVTIVRSPAG